MSLLLYNEIFEGLISIWDAFTPTYIDNITCKIELWFTALEWRLIGKVPNNMHLFWNPSEMSTSHYSQWIQLQTKNWVISEPGHYSKWITFFLKGMSSKMIHAHLFDGRKRSLRRFEVSHYAWQRLLQNPTGRPHHESISYNEDRCIGGSLNRHCPKSLRSEHRSWWRRKPRASEGPSTPSDWYSAGAAIPVLAFQGRKIWLAIPAHVSGRCALPSSTSPLPSEISFSVAGIDCEHRSVTWPSVCWAPTDPRLRRKPSELALSERAAETLSVWEVWRSRWSGSYPTSCRRREEEHLGILQAPAAAAAASGGRRNMRWGPCGRTAEVCWSCFVAPSSAPDLRLSSVETPSVRCCIWELHIVYPPQSLERHAQTARSRSNEMSESQELMEFFWPPSAFAEQTAGSRSMAFHWRGGLAGPGREMAYIHAFQTREEDLSPHRKVCRAS